MWVRKRWVHRTDTFYLYFLQPFEPPHFEDQKLADEVFFRLTGMDKQFQDTLRLYAGAREMAASASTATKRVYEDKADGFLKTLVAWLRTNMLKSFDVIHQGVPKKMVEWLKGPRPANATVRELLELTGSVCLAASRIPSRRLQRSVRTGSVSGRIRASSGRASNW
jgi:hypothetical protein